MLGGRKGRKGLYTVGEGGVSFLEVSSSTDPLTMELLERLRLITTIINSKLRRPCLPRPSRRPLLPALRPSLPASPAGNKPIHLLRSSQVSQQVSRAAGSSSGKQRTQRRNDRNSLRCYTVSQKLVELSAVALL
jgi:hypothetical protein